MKARSVWKNYTGKSSSKNNKAQRKQIEDALVGLYDSGMNIERLAGIFKLGSEEVEAILSKYGK